MRVLTRVNTGAPQGEHRCTPPRTQVHPYKENNTKKTTQPVCVSSVLSKGNDRALFGESEISKLIDQQGKEAVLLALSVWDNADRTQIRSPIRWLKKAIREKWEPSKTNEAKFPQCTFDHDKIIKAYIKEHGREKCQELSRQGLSRRRIAYKIWTSKI